MSDIIKKVVRALRNAPSLDENGYICTKAEAIKAVESALSNLDAAAPASGGDAEPVAWRMLFAGFDEITTDKAKADRFRDYVTVEPLYAAPPLQAPAHSDAVRVKLAQKMLRAVMTAEDGAGTLPAKESVKLRPKDFHKLIDLARECAAALTPPTTVSETRRIEKLLDDQPADFLAPAVSEADVGAAEIAGLVTAAAKVIADWSADCKVDDDSIVLLLTAYNAMKPCGVLLLNEVESAIQSAAQGGGTEGGEG